MTNPENLLKGQERENRVIAAKQVIGNMKENKEDPHLASINLEKLSDQDYSLYADIIRLRNELSQDSIDQESLRQKFFALENQIKEEALVIDRQSGFRPIDPKRQEIEEQIQRLRKELREDNIGQEEFEKKERELEKAIKAGVDSVEECPAMDSSHRDFYAFLLNKLVALKIKL